MRRFLVLAGALLICTCDNQAPDDEATLRVGFIVPSGSTFTATLDGRTYHEAGTHTLSLKHGNSYEVVGSFSGAIGVVFSGPMFNERGGVRRGSVENDAGPSR